MIDRDNLTPAQARFIAAFEAGASSVSAALKLSGTPRSTLRAWRQLEGWAQVEAEAQLASNDVVLDEIRRRAVMGDYEVVTDSNGQTVFMRDLDTGHFILDENFERIPLIKPGKKSDRLLELEAKIRGLVPTGGSTSIGVEVPGANGAPPTRVVVNFVKPPDWENIEWGEDGRPVLDETHVLTGPDVIEGSLATD